MSREDLNVSIEVETAGYFEVYPEPGTKGLVYRVSVSQTGDFAVQSTPNFLIALKSYIYDVCHGSGKEGASSYRHILPSASKCLCL